MQTQHGDFVWYELMTDNLDAAQNFYGKVIGWSFEEAGFNDLAYRAFSAGGQPFGGFLGLTDEMKSGGARPAWLGYINVTDVPLALANIRKAGGKVLMEGQEVPGVGPFAMVADPQGAAFYIINDRSGEPSDAFAATEPMVGHCAWNELATSDQAAAVDFYTDQFGWQQKEEMDMGPMGAYKFFHHGPGMIGAVMKKPNEMPVSAWTYYFRVTDIDVAVDTIKSNGGQITLEPTEIPGGEFQLNAVDPQGAHFALVGPKK